MSNPFDDDDVTPPPKTVGSIPSGTGLGLFRQLQPTKPAAAPTSQPPTIPKQQPPPKVTTTTAPSQSLNPFDDDSDTSAVSVSVPASTYGGASSTPQSSQQQQQPKKFMPSVVPSSVGTKLAPQPSSSSSSASSSLNPFDDDPQPVPVTAKPAAIAPSATISTTKNTPIPSSVQHTPSSNPFDDDTPSEATVTPQVTKTTTSNPFEDEESDPPERISAAPIRPVPARVNPGVQLSLTPSNTTSKPTVTSQQPLVTTKTATSGPPLVIRPTPLSTTKTPTEVNKTTTSFPKGASTSSLPYPPPALSPPGNYTSSVSPNITTTTHSPQASTVPSTTTNTIKTSTSTSTTPTVTKDPTGATKEVVTVNEGLRGEELVAVIINQIGLLDDLFSSSRFKRNTGRASPAIPVVPNSTTPGATPKDSNYTQWRLALMNNASTKGLISTEGIKDRRNHYLRFREQLLVNKFGRPDIRNPTVEKPLPNPLPMTPSPVHTSATATPSKPTGRPRASTVGGEILPVNRQSWTKKTAGTVYAFAGVHHIFTCHSRAVKVIKFANDDRDLLAFASDDGTISVCSVLTNPTCLKTLSGHTQSVTDFDWGMTNDTIVSTSADKSLRIWVVADGSCPRIIPDKEICWCCRYLPTNGNIVIYGTGPQNSLQGSLIAVNASTGRTVGLLKTKASVLCMTFDGTGSYLFVGDSKGIVTTLRVHGSGPNFFEPLRTSNVVSPPHSLQFKGWTTNNTYEPTLLACCLDNSVRFLGCGPNVLGTFTTKNKFVVRSGNNRIRASFCPLISKDTACIVCGSEDSSVYIFDLLRSDNKPINKLQGHSGVVFDVCWSYDETMLASCDQEGTALGYFSDECLDAKIIAGGPGFDPVVELTSGRAQFANLWAGAVIGAREANIPLVVVSQLWQSHKVGVWDVTGLPTEVRALALSQGVQLSEYDEEIQPFNVLPLFDKSLDVISAMTYNELSLVFETINPDTEDLWSKDDLYIVSPADSGVVIVEDGVAVTEEFLENNSTIVEAFLRGLTKGWLACRETPEYCVGLLPISDDHQRWMMNEVNHMLWLHPGSPFGIPTEAAWNSSLVLTHSIGAQNNSISDPIYTRAINTTIQRNVDAILSTEGYDVYGENYTYTQYKWCLKCGGDKAELCAIDKTNGTISTEIIVAIVVPFAVTGVVVTIVLVALLHKLKKIHNRVQQLELEIDKRACFSVVGAPAQQAIDTLLKLKRKRFLKDSDHCELSRVVSLIASNRLYNSDMLHQALQNNKVDSDVDAFLVDLLVKHDTVIANVVRSDTASSVMTILNEADPTLSTQRLFRSPPVVAVDASSSALAICGNSGWDFDIFSMAPNTMFSPFEMIGLALLEEFGLVAHFKLDVRLLISFFRRIYSGYCATNPYHNALHAADVAQGMGVLLRQYQNECQAQLDSQSMLTPIELLSAVIASLIHDYGHPGLNNNFMTATMHEIALRYNLLSPLENMHVSESLQILLRSENNFLAQIPKEEYLEFHRNVVTLVLATDMTRHIEITGQFTAKLSAAGNTGERMLKSKVDHLLYLQILLKYADISAPSRKWNICERWAYCVRDEFFAQGDRERALGLPVSPCMDRTNTNWAKCQSSFLKYVVIPLSEAVSKIVDTNSMKIDSNLSDNYQNWASLETRNSTAGDTKIV
ncbi:calcium calmodulin-dependent 3 -cyclic nucleotide phosphodiesterase 1b [Pelomyxa schiedti]|nr:calcium calmodulin-dependent 3 -cyclic nucleotide phosphodiesterase 1b [Pelomyxa schiedti]